MRIAYLDCASGISGDMTLGAMVDAGVELAAIQAGIDSLAWPEGTPNCRLVASEVKKCGFRATQVVVEHEPEHAHRHLHHIQAMIDGGKLTPRARELATAIFRRIAEAEAKVHGSTLEKVHFHEVGAVDSIADIVGAAIGWDLLGVEEVHCSPVPTGTGFIQIAHGRCAIPAPATAELLSGIPLAEHPPSGPIVGELTTPTGAAIVKELAKSFGAMPAMNVESIGYGSGQKDFDHPNLLRLVVGEKSSAATAEAGAPATIVLLETNLDDTPGETIGDCVERLWTAGALDVSMSPLQMKKHRPGVLLSVQATPADADRLAGIVFRHTTALGMRRQTMQRIVLPRRTVTVETEWGTAKGTVATLPDGAGERFTPEYEDCKALADRAGVTVGEVSVAAAAAYRRQE